MTDSTDADIEVVDLAARIEAEPAPKLVPPSPAARGVQPAAIFRRRLLLAAGATGVIVLVWVVVAAVTAVQIRNDVAAARDALTAGRDEAFAGDLESARDRFGDAAATLGSLPGRVDSPRLWPARQIRSIRGTLNAVGSLGQAGEVAALAARDVTAALVGDGGGLGRLTPTGGRLPIEAIAALEPVLAVAATSLEDAISMAERTPVIRVDSRVVEARSEMIQLLQPAARQVRLGSDFAAVFPALFGADGPRRYAVFSANPTETRATGGFFGAFSVVEVDDGMLEFGEVVETQGLPIPRTEDVPWGDPSLSERYDPYGGATRLRSINMTPDFPSAASAIERFFETVLDTDIDGVISVDPFAFEALLRVSGPIELPQLGEVGADEVVDVVSYTAYALVEDPEARKRLIGTVAASAFQGFLEGPGEVQPSAVLDAVGEMTGRDSLLIHSARPEEQALLEEAGLAGKFSAGEGDLLAMTLNSGSGSKIDYWLDRTIRYEVSLEDEGRISAIVTAGLTNSAPDSGELTYMIGPPGPDVAFGPGDNITWFSTYCAPGCDFVEVPDRGYQDLATTIQGELDFVVASTWVEIPSMQSRQLVYSYEVPGAWTSEDGDRLYRLLYDHQTTIRPAQLEVRVAVPPGFEAVDIPEGAIVEDEHVVLRTEATADADLSIRFRPS